MIFGDINNTKDMETIYPNAIMKAINYLKNTDFNNLVVKLHIGAKLPERAPIISGPLRST